MYEEATTIIPDLVIAPGGHVEFCCATFTSGDTGGGVGMARRPLADAYARLIDDGMLTSEVREFYQSLDPVDRKQFDGLEEFNLMIAIQDAYNKSVLDKFMGTLPASVQKKIVRLDDDTRYLELSDLRHASIQKQSDAEQIISKNIVTTITQNFVPQQQELFAPYHHELSRKSLYFIDENKGQVREHLTDFVIGTGSWGYTVYSGVKLYIGDEKTYVILAGIAEQQRLLGIQDWHIVRGSIRSFLRQAGLPENGDYTDRFVLSLEALYSGSFTFESKDFKEKLHDNRLKKKRMKDKALKAGFRLISNYEVDSVNKSFTVILDRVYIETFIRSMHMYSRIDVRAFCKLPPTSAALFRFFSSHTPGPDGCIRMNLLTVVKNNNMLTDFPQDVSEWPDKDVKAYKKKLIVRGLTRLVTDGLFGPRTSVVSRKRGDDDMVVIDMDSPRSRVIKSAAGKKLIGDKKKA
ncbi:hypothetical protein FY034_17665 (plasmid) [Trichlorobacter lovleyi]|uniref:hypothetical protein n=1 Tax=Trichlorobacter lovleyi TaxID=313985 RepID=UPI00223FDDA0|nr:hypothetical protein [Trichlorobacter lovleyi]QOX80852.1 hypothetical protein FY034_17665 [Trichlorobacter lovleyi]